MKRNSITVILLVSVFTLSASLTFGSNVTHGKIDAKTLQKLNRGDKQLDVIVLLKGYQDFIPTVKADHPAQMATSQASIHSRQNSVLNKIPASQLKIKHRFKNILGFSARVDQKGIQKIASLSDVAVIEEDAKVEAHMAQGIPLMNALPARTSYNGSGVSIAVVDTGIDYNHPMLGGGGFPNSKVIGGYDFGDIDADPLDCEGHGTSVAGIAAGTLASGPGDYIGGVAHNAKLYALKIISGCSGGAYESDIIAAWGWAVSHKNDDPANPILVINTSFGGGKYLSSCDGSHQSLAAAANNAVANGITLLVSSGNDGYVDGIGSPACLSNAISVGAVYDADIGSPTYGVCSDATTSPDQVACYSNSAEILDMLAPSNNAYTPTDGGGYSGTFGGTSAASPYAAGLAALLQSYAESKTGSYYSPTDIKDYLLTGGQIIDPRNNIAKPRATYREQRYVGPAGIDAGDCTNPLSPCRTIQYAIDQAGHYDYIKVAQGTYNENISIPFYITGLFVQGGWSTDFSTRNEDPSLTVVDGDTTEDGIADGDVIAIAADEIEIEITIQNFTITNGNRGIITHATCCPFSSRITLNLNDNVITGNLDTGIYTATASYVEINLYLNNNMITGNNSNGVYLYSLGRITAVFANNVITGNSGSPEGGGVYISAQGYGTINLSLINNTIKGNSATSDGGGLYAESRSFSNTTVDIINTIIWGNSATGSGDDIFLNESPNSTTVVNASYSDIGDVVNDPVEPGTYNDLGNNINADPLFINHVNSDYHLQAGSPCIDAGTDINAPSADFDGDIRPIDGDGNGTATTDIGADEFKIKMTVLVSGVSETGSVAYKEWEYYQISSSATDIELEALLTGLSADVDLYVRAGLLPTLSTYDCRSFSGGTSAETCILPNTGATVWYIGVYGWAAGSYTITANLEGVCVETGFISITEDQSLTGNTIDLTSIVNTVNTKNLTYTVTERLPLCYVNPGGTYIDAEDFSGTIVQGLGTFLEETAQGGYLGSGYLRSDEGSGSSCPPVDEGKEFRVYVNENDADLYTVWMRGYAADTSTDSLFIGVDGTCVGALHEGGTYNQWVWSSSIQTGTNTINLTPGIHTINIWVRERNHLIDGIYLTNDGEPPTDTSHGTEIDLINCPRVLFSGNHAEASMVDTAGWTDRIKTLEVTGDDDTCGTPLSPANETFDYTVPISRDRYVLEGRVDTGDCSDPLFPCGTIQYAFLQSNSSDTIKVAQGTYHENVVIERTISGLTIQGGWNSDFSVRNEDPSLTVIDGETNGRGSIIPYSGLIAGMIFYLDPYLYYYDDDIQIEITIEGFTLTNGSYGVRAYTIQGHIAVGWQEIVLTLLNNIISENLSGVKIRDVSLLTMINNIVLDNDYGIDSYQPWVSSLLLINNKIINNSYGVRIEGDYEYQYHHMINNIIAGNGTGISVRQGWDERIFINLMNNTITSNNIGVHSSSNGVGELEIDIYNTVVWGNSSSDIYITGGLVTASYSDIGVVVGPYNDLGNNVNVDPLYADGNYHLSYLSPLINMGDNAAAASTTSDFEGDARIINCIVDIGADEVMPATGLWHEVADSATPGGRPFASACTSSWWYGQDSTGDYDTGTANSGTVISPPYDIGSSEMFSFWSWEQTENEEANDIRTVSISTDGGQNWTVIKTLSGRENQWYKVDIPLESYAGETALFKLTFDTVDDINNNYAGWYMDEMGLEVCMIIYYSDSDGDGYGDAGNTIVACDMPAGYVTDSTDCDDTDSAINPATSWYEDTDSDGFGTLSNPQQQCSRPAGPPDYVLNSTDCNDGDAAIHPDTYWHPDTDGDNYGNPTVNIQQCDQPSGPPDYVLDNTDCNDSDLNIYPGGPPARAVKTGTTTVYHPALQSAYSDPNTVDGHIIEMKAITLNESFNSDRDISISLVGGLDCSYSGMEGFTSINGDMTVTEGTITMEDGTVEVK